MSRRIDTNNIASSSTSSSSPPLPNFQLQESNNKNTSKTMEEVWKDINLTSLHGHPHGGGDQFVDLSVSNLSSSSSRLLHHHHHQNPNFIIQDFLATPLCNKDPPTLTSGNTCKYGSSSSAEPPPPPPPATVLSLYSGPPEFDFFDQAPDRHTHPHTLRPMSSHLDSHPSSNGSPFVGPFEGLDPASGLMPCFGRKRVQESDSSSGDRRHKRMIKNRESAARSRARKQAYTNELELEVAHLMEENARLRRQQEQLRVAVASQLPEKSGLSRTSTAPF